MPSDQFYAQLPVHRMRLGDLLIKERLFREVPVDWHVIITDIKGSTQAVLAGRHQDVNLIATGSIVAVLNIAFEMNMTIPFFFGGDGATFIVPPAMIEKTMGSLAMYKNNTLDNFELELRTGTVTVTDIYAQGHHLHLLKYGSSTTFITPVLVGNGLNYAERLIKGEDYLLVPLNPSNEVLDLSGMQCRWDRIPPPADKEEMVTLLILAQDGAQQSGAFRKVMNRIDEIYGNPQKRQPISVARLKFSTTFSRMKNEMRARLGKVKWLEVFKNWLLNLYGPVYFRTKNGREYLNNLVEMSDTLVIDGKINTVISGTVMQRKALEGFLSEMETAKEIIYGLHVSSDSVMSYYVRDLKSDHIHFVDGSEGGYTQAARMVKAKL